MKINILLCDTFPGLLPSYIQSYVSMFQDLFNSVSDDISYDVYNCFDCVFPSIVNGSDIYLITGCNLSAYDDIEWINRLKSWVVMANNLKAKMVGVCFGHQIIAEALGGKVVKASCGWGVGIRESEIFLDEMKLFFHGNKLKLLYNHHDQVVKLPNCAKRIAASSFCPNEGFVIGNNIITFQGHPEYIPEYEVHLIKNFADEEPEDVKACALDSISKNVHDGLLVAKFIIKFFQNC